MISFLLVVLQSILAFCFVLGSIALVHELGHFVTAKLMGIWVMEFAIGFGNRLIKIKHGDTIYSIRPLPLGGFVRLAGMEQEEEENVERKDKSEASDHNSGATKALAEGETGSEIQTEVVVAETGPEESSDKPAKISEQQKAVEDEDEFPVLPPDDPRGFPAKSMPAKLLVLAAGSIMNLVWAIVLFIVMYSVTGGPVSNILVQDVHAGSPAQEAGIVSGDIIVSINGEKITDYTEGVKRIQQSGGSSIQIEVHRNHPFARPGFGGAIIRGDHAVNRGTYETFNQEVLSLTVVPQGTPGAGRIGIGLLPNNYDFTALPFRKAVSLGFHTGVMTIEQTLSGLKRIIFREAPADVAGPVKIMKMIKDQSSKGLIELLTLTAILSINIGLINLFPFPVLDGGKIVFVGIDSFFRLINSIANTKLELTPKLEEKFHFAGFILLVTMIVIVTFNDIRGLF